MALLKNLQEASTGPAGRRQYNTFGAVFQVATAEREGDHLKLTGVMLNANPAVEGGELLSVVFRGDSAGKAVTNFLKGNGKQSLNTKEASQGTFLTLEGCYIDEKAEGPNRVLNARWLNTLASAGDPDHKNRSYIDGVLATAPRITFENPKVEPGEPERITLSVSSKVATGRVRNEHGTFAKEFPVEWAVAKLAAAAGGRMQVSIDTVEPSAAVEVASRERLDQVLGEQLARGTKALSLLRVSDGDDVITRAVYVPFKKEGDEYVPDVAKALDDLGKNNIFKGVPNADLFAGLADGSLQLEAIPGYRMNFAGDPTKDNNAAYKLIEDVKKGNTQRFEMIFGTDAANFAKVILPGIARADGVDSFSPFNVMADAQGTYKANEFGTDNIPAKSVAKAPVQPLEEAGPPATFDDADPHPAPADEDEPALDTAPRP